MQKKHLVVGKLALFLVAGVLTIIGLSDRVLSQSGDSQTPQAPAAPSGNDAYLAELRKQIAGKENEPAENVFKNIQMLKGMPAGRLLNVMNIGYSRSLGVACTHCHVAGEWEKEEKPQKQITREMAKMVRAINTDHLKTIKNLKGPDPVINCTTCHRGQVKPALNLPAAR